MAMEDHAKPPEPQPERNDRRLADPTPTSLSGRDYVAILRRSFSEFRQDNLTTVAAALAYYAFLAIPSVLMMAVGIFALVSDPVGTGSRPRGRSRRYPATMRLPSRRIALEQDRVAVDVFAVPRRVTGLAAFRFFWPSVLPFVRWQIPQVMDARQGDWLREMATWLPNQVRLLGYSPAFRNALADLMSTARAEGACVRETSSAFQGHEGEEALYQFAGRIQGLLELSDREAPEMVGELEEAVRNA